MVQNRGKIWIFICLGLGALVLSIMVGRESIETFLKKQYTKEENMVVAQGEREPWITVFVHGSFGSILGLLNVFQVINDDVEGTSYKKTVSRMRKDNFFYQDQSVLKKGLVPVDPTFDLAVTGNRKYAAYPLIKAYEEMNELAKPGKEKNYFYTFGWSGLLSQHRRCLEAIRFYNALSLELEKYYKNGIYPKIRILTHSHGGNVITYIAAVHEVITCSEYCSVCMDQQGDRVLALKKAQEKIASLPDIVNRKKVKGQKQWDYKPKKPIPSIDELIMWGMPVQPETDCLVASSVFKKVYHFYSDEDLVQRLDWITTKQRYSDRRFDEKRLKRCFKDKCLPNKIAQVRLVVGRNVKKQKVSLLNQSNNIESTNLDSSTKKTESFWSVFFSGGSILNANSQDPTHKELWFFSWDKQEKDVRTFALAPFPAMIFSPMFVNLIGRDRKFSDVDLNIRVDNDGIGFGLMHHKELWLQKEFFVANSILRDLEKKAEPWRSQEVSSEDVFNVIRNYTSNS